MMGFKCGIVGLPNVGKSTLFNALTQTAAAQAANYPFCTIEPNVGDVAVPDPRLDKLAAIAKSAEIIPTRITFVDIAGLVRGASKGEGLGNQFLANIREVDAIAHVLRCFEDDDITHVEGRIDPVGDAETVETELMLADLDSLERRVVPHREEGQVRREGSQGAARADDEGARPACARASPRGWPSFRRRSAGPIRQLGLMTAKPVLYVCNVDEGVGRDGQQILDTPSRRWPRAQGAGCVVDLRAHRGRGRAARRRRARGVSREPRARRARPQPADPRGLCICSA